MHKYTLYLAGDSTVEDVERENDNTSGWGQQLPTFFTNDIQVINKAKSGRSTKSFINEGRLQEILDEISSGDYLFIQFGHNDQKLEDPERGTLPYEEYQENLKLHIQSAREKGAISILVTSVQRRKFDDNGKIIETLGEYPKAMRDVALALDVPIIDLLGKSTEYYENLGPEESKALFAWYELENPEGDPDDTHFGSAGAKKIAGLVVEGMRELNLPFVKYIRS